MTINSSYQLIKHISKEFDNKELEKSNDSFRPELLKIALQQSGSNEFPRLPNLIHSTILQNVVENTHDWLYATGQLGTKQAVLDTGTMNNLASKILKKLKLKEESNIPSREQLYNYMFKQVFANASIEGKHKAIQLAATSNSKDLASISQEISIYRAKKAVGNFFNNPLFMLSNAFLGVGYGMEVLIKLGVTLIDIPTINQIMETREETKGLVNQSILPILAIYFIARRQIPLIRRTEEKAVNYIIREQENQQQENWSFSNAFTKLTASLYSSQKRVIQSFVHDSDNGLQRKLTLGEEKAYTTWKDLREQTQLQGICRLASSQET